MVFNQPRSQRALFVASLFAKCLVEGEQFWIQKNCQFVLHCQENCGKLWRRGQMCVIILRCALLLKIGQGAKNTFFRMLYREAWDIRCPILLSNYCFI